MEINDKRSVSYSELINPAVLR